MWRHQVSCLMYVSRSLGDLDLSVSWLPDQMNDTIKIKNSSFVLCTRPTVVALRWVHKFYWCYSFARHSLFYAFPFLYNRPAVVNYTSVSYTHLDVYKRQVYCVVGPDATLIKWRTLLLPLLLPPPQPCNKITS